MEDKLICGPWVFYFLLYFQELFHLKDRAKKNCMERFKEVLLNSLK